MYDIFKLFTTVTLPIVIAVVGSIAFFTKDIDRNEDRINQVIELVNKNAVAVGRLDERTKTNSGRLTQLKQGE